MGRARLRGHHELPHAHQHHPGQRSARRTVRSSRKFDYPTCETLGLLKMDFLGLRNLTVVSDALCGYPRSTASRTRIWTTLTFDDKKTYELLGRGATPLGVFRSMVAASATSSSSRSPTTSKTSRPWVPCTARADGRELRTRTTRCVERASGDHAHSPRAGGAARGHSGYDIRPGIVYPGAGHADRPEAGGGYSLGQADILRKAMGRRRRRSWTSSSRGFPPGHGGQRLFRGVDQALMGRRRSLLRVRLQQRPLGGLRPRLLLDCLPQGRITRRSTWLPC